MEIVLNKCYGGFGLSPKAIKRIAELQGKECYFFKDTFSPRGHIPITIEEAENYILFSAYSISNPDEFLREQKDWREMTIEEKQASNEKYDSVYLKSRYDYDERNDPILLQVMREIGESEASGKMAELKIVNIPDGVAWEIYDYDGIETAHETHASW